MLRRGRSPGPGSQDVAEERGVTSLLRPVRGHAVSWGPQASGVAARPGAARGSVQRADRRAAEPREPWPATQALVRPSVLGGPQPFGAGARGFGADAWLALRCSSPRITWSARVALPPRWPRAAGAGPVREDFLWVSALASFLPSGTRAFQKLV